MVRGYLLPVYLLRAGMSGGRLCGMKMVSKYEVFKGKEEPAIPESGLCHYTNNGSNEM